ncbi:MAG: mechanosensitive ion channel, partial [Planctomycetes bacterium]|nr:mechanosensitive ion channel [Planctomycetota bacterium]
VIIGGIAIVILMLLARFVHKRLPRTLDWLEHRESGDRFFDVVALVIRRTEFSMLVAVALVGIPWAVGLTRDFVGAMAALFLSPFLYRLGRVLNDVLFTTTAEQTRLVQCEDDLARILHRAGRYLLNLAIVFVPIGLLMNYGGYATASPDDPTQGNPGFVDLWWLIYKVLSQIVALFTVFRPVVVRRLIRGDNVFATSFRNWVLLGYPLILGAFLFVVILGSLRYTEAEVWFARLFLKTLAFLLGGYMVYRMLFRRLLAGRNVNQVLVADDFEDPAEYIKQGQRLFVDKVIRLFLRLVVFGVTIFFVHGAWSELGFGLLTRSISGEEGGMAPADLLWAVMAIIVTLVVVRVVRPYQTFFMAPRMELDQGSAYTVVTLTSYAIFAVGIIATLNLLQVKGEQIAVVMSALMLGIGFGLQSIVKNFVSGLILLVERPVQVGDRIEVDGKSGVVDRITLRATSVMTWDGIGIVIPNEEMIGAKLVNQSAGRPRLRSDLGIGVAYGSDVQKVRSTINEIVRDHGLVLKRPAPELFFVGFGDNSLDFRIYYWTAMNTHRVRVASDLRYAIESAFRREGIEIPYPQRDLHLRTVDGKAADNLAGSKPRPTTVDPVEQAPTEETSA